MKSHQSVEIQSQQVEATSNQSETDDTPTDQIQSDNEEQNMSGEVAEAANGAAAALAGDKEVELKEYNQNTDDNKEVDFIINFKKS